MKHYAMKIDQWLSKRSLREQGLLLITGMVIIYTLLNTILLEPIFADFTATAKTLEQAKKKHNRHLDQKSEPSLISDERTLQSLKSELEILNKIIVSQQSVPELVKKILTPKNNLEITMLDSHLQPLKTNERQKQLETKSLIYKNTLNLDVYAKQHELKEFIAQLEQLPESLNTRSLSWKKMSDNFVRAKLSIEFYSADD